MCFLPNSSSRIIDEDFLLKLESNARCKIPMQLKENICKVIEKYCLSCGFSVNFDVNSLNALPNEMKLTFIKLWKHVYSVCKMSQSLVLDVVRLLSETLEEDDEFGYPDVDENPSFKSSDKDIPGSVSDPDSY